MSHKTKIIIVVSVIALLIISIIFIKRLKNKYKEEGKDTSSIDETLSEIETITSVGSSLSPFIFLLKDQNNNQ